MKSQMENTADITTQLDLAPPTKKLMHWKETGSVDKLFVLPGRAIPSRVLQRLFMRNLYTQAVPDDVTSTGESFQTSNLLSSLSFNSTTQQQQQPLPDQSNMLTTSEVTIILSIIVCFKSACSCVTDIKIFVNNIYVCVCV